MGDQEPPETESSENGDGLDYQGESESWSRPAPSSRTRDCNASLSDTTLSRRHSFREILHTASPPHGRLRSGFYTRRSAKKKGVSMCLKSM